MLSNHGTTRRCCIMKNKILQILLLLSTAVLMTVICMMYIPSILEQRALDQLLVGQLVDESGSHAVWLDGSTTLAVEFTPADKVCPISWSSNDPAVVTIDRNGVMRGVSLGSATVTAAAERGASVSMSVEVIRKPLPSGSDLPELYYDIPIVANGTTPLDGEYIPENLVNIPSYLKVNKNGMTMTAETLEAYSRMALDAEAATGQSLMVISGYRSYATQKRLYDEDVQSFMNQGYSRARAEELTERTTNKPGHSEHQLGNSLDIGTGPSLQYDFVYTPAGKWVTAHAHEYGFILRYPADKTEITTIDYEAWHFRYVGVEHATYIYEHDLCLEEYIQLLHQAAAEADAYAAGLSASEYLSGNAAGPNNL